MVRRSLTHGRRIAPKAPGSHGQRPWIYDVLRVTRIYVALGFGQIAVAGGLLSIGPYMPGICSAGRDCGMGRRRPGIAMASEVLQVDDIAASFPGGRSGNAQALPKCDLSDRKLGLRSSPGELPASTASPVRDWPKGLNPRQKAGIFP